MRDLHHFIELFDETDTVGDQILAEAVYAARHGDADEADPDDLRPLIREMPEVTPPDEAKNRVMAEAVGRACELLSDPDDPRDKGRQALADRLDVHRNTVGAWVRRERNCTGPSAMMVRRIIDEETSRY